MTVTQTEQKPTLLLASQHPSVEATLRRCKPEVQLVVVGPSDDITQQVKPQPPQLIIVDYALKQHEKSLCAMLRQHPITRQTPILAITEDDPAAISNALADGADDCICLPIHEQLLEKRVEILLPEPANGTVPHHQPPTFQLMFEEAPVMMHSTDHSGKIIDVNQHWLDVMGYEREAVLDRPITHFLTEESARQANDKWLPLLWQQGRLEQVPCEFMDARSNTLDMLVDSRLIAGLNGSQVSICVVQDITSQKAIETSLRESEEETRAILQALPDIIMVQDAEGRYLRVAPTNASKFYLPPDEILGRTFTEIFSKDDAFDYMDKLRTVLETRKSLNFEYTLPINEMTHWFSATLSPMAESDRVVCIIRDITDRTQAETALRASDQRYRYLFENANDLIFLIDSVTNEIVDANTQAAKQLGYSREELLTLTIDEIEIPYDFNTTEKISVNIFRQDQFIFEQIYRRKDGSLLSVESSSRLLTYDDRRVILTFARDITDRKKVEQAERQQRLLNDALRDVTAALTGSVKLDEVLDLILDNVNRVVSSEYANIMLIEDGVARVERYRGYVQSEADQALIENMSFVIAETPNIREMANLRQFGIIEDTMELGDGWIRRKGSESIRSQIGAPIIYEDELIGFVFLDSPLPNQFTIEQAERLQIFANQAAVAIKNARLFDSVQRYADELEERVEQRTQELRQTNDALTDQIRERARIEAKLQDERNLLQTLIDHLPDFIFVKDMAGRFILGNEVVLGYYNLKKQEDLIGKTPLELGDQKNPRKIQEEDRRVISGETIINQEFSFYDTTGTVRWMLSTKVPLLDNSGEITGIVGIDHDITSIKQAEEQLQQILTSARCLLWFAIVDERKGNHNWNLHIANEEAAQSFLPLVNRGGGYTQSWLASIHVQDRWKRHAAFKSCLSEARSNYTLEFRILTENQQIRWLNEDVQVRQLVPGRWSLVGVCTDITDLKDAEATLQRANEELEQRVARRTEELTRINETLKQEIADRRRAEKSERDQRILAEALQETGSILSSTLELDKVLDRLLASIATVVPHEGANIMLLDGQSANIVRHWGYRDTALDLQLHDILSLEDYRKCVETGKPFITFDAQNAPYWTGSQDSGKIRSNIHVPIRLQDEIIGLLNLDSINPNNFTEAHGERLQSFADQAGIAIHNARMYEQAQMEIAQRKQAEESEREQRTLAEALADAAAILTSRSEIDAVLNRILQLVSRVVTSHDAAMIMLIDYETNIAHTASHIGYEDENVDKIRLNLEDVHGLRQMLQTQQPIIIHDTQTAADWVSVKQTAWIRSYLGAPITVEDKVIGFINLDSSKPNVFSEIEGQRLQAFASQAGVAIQNARLVAEIRSYADDLENRVKERTAELEGEQAQLRAILDSMHDGVIYQGNARQEKYTNQALVSLTEYTTDEWINGDITIMDVHRSEEDDTRHKRRIERSLAQQGFWRGESKVRRKDGTEFDANLTFITVKDVNDKAIGQLTVMRDISRDKELEEQKARFIASASHELRTPIANLKTRLYLMRRQPQKLKEHLDIADSVANWMQGLVETMFDIARFQRGIIELEMENVILQKIIIDVEQFQQPAAREKDVILERNFSDELVLVQADPNRLTQVLINLVGNAINHTPEGGIVTLHLFKAYDEAEEETFAYIQVQDTGSGIDAETLPHIFQPFYQADKEKRGAGLGLSISKEIIDRHKGHISVDSALGEGTTFIIKLPVPEES